jgi:hypothetical protein
MQYFDLPNCCIAFNAKVGSTSLACAIVKQIYPHLLEKTLREHQELYAKLPPEFIVKLPDSFQKMLNNHKLDSMAFWQSLCPRVQEPNKPVLLAVRDPVERFASTVAYLNMDVDDTLHKLENRLTGVIFKLEILICKNTHYLKQASYLTENTKLYKFPDQFQQLCVDAGLQYPVEKINEGKNKKPILSENQIERVKAYYHKDVELFESLM